MPWGAGNKNSTIHSQGVLPWTIPPQARTFRVSAPCARVLAFLLHHRFLEHHEPLRLPPAAANEEAARAPFIAYPPKKQDPAAPQRGPPSRILRTTAIDQPGRRSA